MTKYLTFKDLKERGIFSNWSTLLRTIDNCGFPPGVRTSSSRRAWSETDVEAWLNTRQIKPIALASAAQQ